MQSFTHIIADPLGLHARPAALLVKTASSYQSAITISTANGIADAKRIMALMRLAAKQGTELTVIVKGTDEVAAASELKAFLQKNL